MNKSTQDTAKRLGDFSGLDKNYAKYRQGYADSVLTAILALIGKAPADIDAVDLGAGTGIWTRMLASHGLRSVHAVEPNDDMRTTGAATPAPMKIEWIAAPGETPGLPTGSVDLVTAASSFHWMDYDVTTKEIHRMLRPGGRFVALWNPREIEHNPLLVEIEDKLRALAPEMKRVSSGNSAFTSTLTPRFTKTPGFDDVLYIEGRHTARQTPDQYMGAWHSVNDVQAQLGPARWQEFLTFAEARIKGHAVIETVFATRAWTMRRMA
jgi:ubiquinone/menaquinone biosynthesis C-methylase UbiE